MVEKQEDDMTDRVTDPECREVVEEDIPPPDFATDLPSTNDDEDQRGVND